MAPKTTDEIEQYLKKHLKVKYEIQEILMNPCGTFQIYATYTRFDLCDHCYIKLNNEYCYKMSDGCDKCKNGRIYNPDIFYCGSSPPKIGSLDDLKEYVEVLNDGYDEYYG